MTTYGSNEALWILSGCLLLNPEWGRLKHWDYLQCSWIKKPHFEYTEQCGKLKPVLLHFNFHFIHLSLFFYTATQDQKSYLIILSQLSQAKRQGTVFQSVTDASFCHVGWHKLCFTNFFFIWCSSKYCIFHSSILNWEHYTELQEIKHVT